PGRDRPCPAFRCRERWAWPSGIGPYLDDAALRAGDRAAQQQQVAVGDDVDDLEPALRDAGVAHVAGAADALEDARRGGRRTDRARRADVVRAVRDRAPGEAGARDGA